MYATIRLYTLNPIFERDFIVRWTSLVEELKLRSLVADAVLHRENRISYISYVKFADKETYLHTRGLLKNGDEAAQWQRIMECCNSITELHRMEVIEEQQQTS